MNGQGQTTGDAGRSGVPFDRSDKPDWLPAVISVLILLAGAVFSLWGMSRIRMDNDDIIRWLPDGSPARADFDFFRQHFGTDEYLVVAWEDLRVDDPRLDALVEKLRDAKSADLIASVVSGKDMLDALSGPGGFANDSVVRKRFAGVFFGKDDPDQTCIVITLTQSGRENRARSLEVLEQSLAEVDGLSPDQVSIAGYPWVAVNMNRMIESSLRKFLRWSAVVATLAALFCLRSISLTATGLVVSGIGAGFAIGLGALFSGSLGGLTMIVPSLGFVLTMSGALHIMRYAAMGARDVRSLLRVSWLPCAVSSGTTIIGVLTLLNSSYPSVREFAVQSAITLGYSLFIQLFALPWLILAFGRRGLGKQVERITVQRQHWDWPSRVSTHVLLAIPVITIGLFIASIVGVMKLYPNVQSENLFRKNSPVLSGIRELESRIGPMDRTEAILVFDKVNATGFDTRLRFVRELEKKLKRVPEVDQTFSIATLIPPPPGRGSINELTGEMYRTGLEDRRQSLGESDYLRVEGNREIWRISVKFPFFSRHAPRELESDVQRVFSVVSKAAEKQWEGFRAPKLVYTGAQHLVTSSQESLLADFAINFALAFAIITPILMIAVRSVTLGILGMFANLFPVTAVFGTIGWLGIPVDVALGITATVALGIAVDDTTHFLHRYHRNRKVGGVRGEHAVGLTLLECGPAMLATTLIACAGIGIYGLSDLAVISRFSLAITAMLVVAIIADAIIVPAVLALVHRYRS
jgi:uncharacterized protein